MSKTRKTLSGKLPNNKKKKLKCNSDISENIIREKMPNILKILLVDRTSSKLNNLKNIIWANNNYIGYGAKYYSATSQIYPFLVTGQMGNIIKPRALKNRGIKKERTKLKAEVFTPTEIVKKQNDKAHNEYINDDLITYTKRLWLEVACGEAPYMATRYDMETGDIIQISNRVGFIDYKLKRINNEINDKNKWQSLVEMAYKSSYGFEWNGDSLLLARENLLYTYRDYYFDKWGEDPTTSLFEKIATIISYNVFQMDGVKFIIPLSEQYSQVKTMQLTLDLFEEEQYKKKYIIKPGKKVKIMNWELNKMGFFDDEVNR